MTIKNISILLILSVINNFVSYSQNDLQIKGVLKSKQNNEAIAYASILDITDYKYGTTSKEDGTFLLKIPAYNKEVDYKIKITCIGYKDTIVNLSSLKKNNIIKLLPKVYQLPEVILSSGKKIKENHIGLPGGTLLKNDKGENEWLIPNNLAEFSSSGVFVKIKKNTKGILKSIDIFLLEKGFPDSPFSIQILVPHKEEVKRNRMYSSSDFINHLEEPIIFQGKAGWNNIDIESYNIAIPPRDFLVLFTPLNYGEKYKWKDSSGDWYGMVIGVYKKRRIPQLFWAYKRRGFYSYDDTPNQRNFTPAVVIKYFEK